MTSPSVPISITDPINARILAVSEDRIEGFHVDPFQEISRRCGLEMSLVRQRIVAMLDAGTIRRVRQTLLATNLASGALVAWQVPEAKLAAAFDYMFQQDPFSGHVVIRTADPATPGIGTGTGTGSRYRLWTTLKVPQGYSLENHCQYVAAQTGALQFRIMPAKRLFVLGVGHVRRRELEAGARSDQPAQVIEVQQVQLSELDWSVLEALKREFRVDEIKDDPWRARAQEAGLPLETFLEVSRSLNQRGVIGRFSTFLEHVKPLANGERVTRFNALFHWAVPPGREIEAGLEVGRHLILTHAYWREGGPEFHNVNLMAVAHGTDKAVLLAHKAAIDRHLAEAGLPVSYTNVFWGGRSEIKPSEISPIAYRQWCERNGLSAADKRR